MHPRINQHVLRTSLAAGFAVFGAATGARAQTLKTCDELNLPNPIFGNGGSAVTADLAKVAAALAGSQNPITIFYSDDGGACDQFKAFLANKVTAKFHYWAADGTQTDCTGPIDNSGHASDFAHMGNPAELCNVAVPDTVKDLPGPVQTINFITGPQSAEQSISADAAYVAYGFASLSPWTNTAHIVKRSGTSFASLLVSAAIGVPGTAFKGDTQASTQGDVVKAVVQNAVANAQDGLGYVSSSAAEKAGSTVKTLAFQAKDQTCGFWPDSTPSARDKANVRNGQYGLWTPGHFFARVDSKGKPVNQAAADLIGWYNGSATPPAGIDVVGLTIDAGDIPLCAMHVTRVGLLGAIGSVNPDEPCGHFFEKRATGSTSGTACSADSDCKNVKDERKCSYGYCEAAN